MSAASTAGSDQRLDGLPLFPPQCTYPTQIQTRACPGLESGHALKGISVIIVDIVTNRRANLHNEILRVMEAADTLQLPLESNLYAAAYRPLQRNQRAEIDVWRSPLALGQALPTLPLGLRADVVIPVDFEAAYAESCLRKRLTGI